MFKYQRSWANRHRTTTLRRSFFVSSKRKIRFLWRFIREEWEYTISRMGSKITLIKIGDYADKIQGWPRFAMVCSLALVITVTVVKAGSLTPSANPAATGYTLGDIYARLISNTTVDEADHDFAPGSSPADSFNTLEEIYEAIPTIVANTVKSGTTYLGVAGTLLPTGGDATVANVLAGKTFFGASQTNWQVATGTMANNGSFGLSASTTDQAVTAGYYSGGTLVGDPDLVAGNIANSVEIFGVTGNLVAGYLYGSSSAAQVLTSAGAGAGTYNADNLTVGTVKSGTLFGVGLTGEYPSITYPLDGDTSAPDAEATNIKSGVEAWSKTGAKILGTFDPYSLQRLQTKDDWLCSGATSCAGPLTEYTAEEATWTTATTTFSGHNAINFSLDDYPGKTVDLYSDTVKIDGLTGLWWSDIMVVDDSTTATTTTNNFDLASAGGDGHRPTGGNAIGFCEALNSYNAGAGFGGYTDWYLPTQKELMQAYIDGSANVPSFNPGYSFWSSTENNSGTASAWNVYLYLGATTNNYKTTSRYYVRCVRR